MPTIESKGASIYCEVHGKGSPISEEVSTLLPNVEFIAEWKTGAVLEAARPRIRAFLKKHTPAAA